MKSRSGSDPHQDIDRILTALGNTQPPAHLERRVLAALEACPAPAARRPRPTSWIAALSNLLPSLRPWSIAACAAVIVLIAVAISARRSSPHGIATLAPALTVTRPPATLASAAEVADGPDIIPSPAKPKQRNLPHIAAVSQHPRQLLCDCDPTALAESNAPSLSPPPLPLTQQEKLLLRIARHPGSVELAELDPAQREAAIARERTAYKNFFHPPAPAPQQAPAVAEQEQTSTATPSGDQQ